MSRPSLVCLFTLVVSVGTVTCATLRLTSSHPRISFAGTPDFSLNCSADNLASRDGRHEHISKIRILKHIDGRWSTIAEVGEGCERLTVAETLQGSVKYHRSGSEIHSIRVAWPLATNVTRGEYICDVIGYSETSLPLVERSQSLYVDVEMPLTLFELLIRMETSNKKMTMTVANMDTSMKEGLRKTQKQLSALYSNSSHTWPEGEYSLLQAATGCPVEIGVTWQTGYRTHHTESTESKNTDRVSAPLHLMKPYLYKINNDNFMRQHFCTVPAVSSSRQPWPPGSYCIMKNKENSCPTGFQVGYIYWDDQDANNKNNVSGVTPANLTDTNTGISYCCRNDSAANNPIALPTLKPFFLHRYGGECQKVTGMKVTEEFMLFDVDCCASAFKGFTPDGKESLSNVKLNLCYYDI